MHASRLYLPPGRKRSGIHVVARRQRQLRTLASIAEEGAFATLAEVNLAMFDADGRKVMLSGLGGMLTLERR